MPDEVRAHEHCEQCAFDGSRYDGPTLLAAIRDLGPRWRALLTGAGERLRVRPEPETWSALEYAAHSRDITALHVFGVEQALTGTEPRFPAFDPGLADSTAATYNSESVDVVLDALDEHACRLASVADDAGEGAWSRGITLGDDRSDVRWLLEHALHDSTHHLQDVERGLS
jgi:DinB superfamily